jgi:hypothetical protein
MIAIFDRIELDKGGAGIERTDETPPSRSEIMINGGSSAVRMRGGSTGSRPQSQTEVLGRRSPSGQGAPVRLPTNVRRVATGMTEIFGEFESDKIEGAAYGISLRLCSVLKYTLSAVIDNVTVCTS